MLAHALLAMLPLVQAASATCRLTPPVATACFSLPGLKGREVHVPINTTRLEPDALRLCAESQVEESIDLGVLLPASLRRTRGMDSVVQGLTATIDSLGDRSEGHRVALTISRLGAPFVKPLLLPAATVPDPTAQWQQAVAQSTTSENALVTPIALLRAVLDGTRGSSPSSGDTKLLVIFVHGMPADWEPYVRAGLELTSIQDPGGLGLALLPLQVETHVVLVEDAETLPIYPILETATSPRGAQPHHLVAPTSIQVDSLLRDILAHRRDRPPAGAGTFELELRNTDLATSSWTDAFLPADLSSHPFLDSALPLQEGPNALELRRTRRIGPFTLRDTTRLSILADLPAAFDSSTPGEPDVGWTCRPSQLRIERIPTPDRPILELSLETIARGLRVQELFVQDSALGGRSNSVFEARSESHWVGNLEAPLDQPAAPFSISSRGDMVVARWHPPVIPAIRPGTPSGSIRSGRGGSGSPRRRSRGRGARSKRRPGSRMDRRIPFPRRCDVGTARRPRRSWSAKERPGAPRFRSRRAFAPGATRRCRAAKPVPPIRSG